MTTNMIPKDAREVYTNEKGKPIAYCPRDGIGITDLQRIEFYQTASEGRFKCEENRLAIMFLKLALEALNMRTQRRESDGVEGTHEGS